MSDRIEQLEAKVAAMEKALNRLLESYTKTGEKIQDSIAGLLEFDDERREDTAEIFQRLKQVENHLFPGINRDIQDIYRITKSDTPPRHNYLDKRDPKKN